MADAPANAAEDLLHIPPFLDRRGENGSATASQPGMFEPLSDNEKAEAASAASSASTPPTNKVPITPVPDDAPPMRFRHPVHGEPSMTWPYHDADGRLVGYVCRWDYTDAENKEDKDILPVTYCDLGNGRCAWRSAGFPTPRPLFGLPDIQAKPDTPVLMTEGEKACNGAAALFPDFVVTTPPHGAKSPHKADWAPLNGRVVVVWPDNDDSGADYARDVARLASAAGAASVAIVDVPADFSEGWDLADPLPDGWTPARLREPLDAAQPYQPEPEPEATTEKTGRARRDWPFRVGLDGVLKRVEKEDKQTGEVEIDWRWFASRLEVVAETRDADGESWGRLLVVTDRDDQRHEWALPMEMLAGSGEEYRRRLLSLGMVMAPGRFARDALHEYLSTAQTDAKARCVPRLGWHGHAFVLPDETVGDTQGERVLLQIVGTFEHAFRTSGTLADWQQNVARYAVGNSRLALSISTAFAAPLLHLTSDESGGFHLRGASSIGKTTALSVAGSAWGGGGLKGYIRQWRATDNGLEAVAQAHCDALLCLDELSQIDARAAGATAYMLANGAGKSRAGRGGEGRTPAEWRVLFLSSGEIGIADKVQEDGRRRATAGQAVRVVDIPADAGAGLGLFEHLHDFPDADALARHLKQAAAVFYGTAVREFLAKIAAKPDEIQEAVAGFRAEFTNEHCPAGADGQVSRVAARFGLVAAAGELATRMGIVPWQSGEAATAAAKCFRAWLEVRGGIEPAEVTAGIAQVRKFIEMHGESRFTACDDPDRRPTINRAGYRRQGDAGGLEYFVMKEVWRKEVCAGLDAGAVAKALAARGMLIPDKDGKVQSRHKLTGTGKTTRYYRLSAAILGDDDA